MVEIRDRTAAATSYEARASAIEAITARHRAIGDRLHEAGLRRWRLNLAVRALHAGLFADARRGVAQLRIEWIAAPGARYLLLDLDGPGRGIAHRQRVTTTVLRVMDAGRIADEATGRVQRIDPKGVYPTDAWVDWRAEEAAGGPIWTDPLFRSPSFNKDVVLLPLTGPSVEGPGAHPAFARMAAYAAQVLGGGVVDLRAMRDIDADLAAGVAERDTLLEEARNVALAGFERTELEARHADLVARLRDHDWTWGYADRFLAAAADEEERIHAALAGIDPSEALALWMHHSYDPLGITSWASASSRMARERRAA